MADGPAGGRARRARERDPERPRPVAPDAADAYREPRPHARADHPVDLDGLRHRRLRPHPGRRSRGRSPMRPAPSCGATPSCMPDDPATWTRPVIRLADVCADAVRRRGQHAGPACGLRSLVGAGTLAAARQPGHVPGALPLAGRSRRRRLARRRRASATTDRRTSSTWRVNVRSRGRALLMLFLFSDVGDGRRADAHPRRLASSTWLACSHRPARRACRCASWRPTASRRRRTAARSLATGDAGTVYLCHPFLVHAAQPHRGIAASIPGPAAAAPRVTGADSISSTATRPSSGRSGWRWTPLSYAAIRGGARRPRARSRR